jgi:dTDP-glucose 4,6-dehydratase
MNVLQTDLVHILENAGESWHALKNKTILLTGGTGFFGIWFQKSFAFANYQLDLHATLIVLTRNKAIFLNKYPELSEHPFIQFIKGDITGFEFPKLKIDFIIHAAATAGNQFQHTNELVMFDTIVNGTKRILDLALQKKVEGFLFISSGAVYGKQPEAVLQMSENYLGGPDISSKHNVYAEAKRMAENLCAIYHQNENIPVKIARCFAFAGPYLPLDAHLAFGNIISDVLQKKNIHLTGDGKSIRSYMYAADLMIWLWTILAKGKSNYPYNVGSDQGITILDLANLVIQQSGQTDSKVYLSTTNLSSGMSRYIPDISRATNELKLSVRLGLEASIQKTLLFYTNNRT